MNLRSIRIERFAVAALLLVIGACCLVVAWSAASLEHANGERRTQLSVLQSLILDPSEASVDRIEGLVGLYDRRLVCVETDYGRALEFGAVHEVTRDE